MIKKYYQHDIHEVKLYDNGELNLSSSKDEENRQNVKDFIFHDSYGDLFLVILYYDGNLAYLSIDDHYYVNIEYIIDYDVTYIYFDYYIDFTYEKYSVKYISDGILYSIIFKDKDDVTSYPMYDEYSTIPNNLLYRVNYNKCILYVTLDNIMRISFYNKKGKNEYCDFDLQDLSFNYIYFDKHHTKYELYDIYETNYIDKCKEFYITLNKDIHKRMDKYINHYYESNTYYENAIKVIQYQDIFGILYVNGYCKTNDSSYANVIDIYQHNDKIEIVNYI